ncbi:MAG: sel1 repeat family protein [Lachnospiraceae bacterium]|nr:sel1 repeat family protein [Lachnospiraceae bacterium]
MRIENAEELKERIAWAISAVSETEDYPESLEALTDLEDELEYCELQEVKEEAAERLYEADAAKPMHPEAARLLIDIYEDGIESGDAAAMCDLGSLYYTGRAGEQNYEKAAFYYAMADREGDRQATENLGYIYYYGRTGTKDYEKAFHYFLKGALDGHLRSLYKIGDFYKNGYYVEKDPKEAYRIYMHCIEQLSDESIPLVGADVYMRMGDCLYEGTGVERDLLAAQHFMSSAEGMFYQRLIEGDFHQKHNLEHVLDVLDKIRKEIKEKTLPDLSWAGYDE